VPLENPEFQETHWSVVLTAGLKDTKRADEALARLCQTYWLPLYSFVRRRGYSPHDAQDLTQDFFARLLEKRLAAAANPKRGKFRSFLLASLKNFLANEWDRTQAQKRGGGATILSWDAEAAEALYARDSAAQVTPEVLFDRHCALTLMEQAMEKLERENAERPAQFAQLKEFLTSPPPAGGYEAVASELQMPAGSVAVAVHRLRGRFRQLLRAEVAQTVATPAEVDDELRHLCEAL
jgi:RNA polymerase sigma factor (sigma-70 family)